MNVDEIFLIIVLLRSATKLGQGNIFRSVCQEFCPQRGEGHAWQGACVAGSVRGRGHAWQGGGGICGKGHAWLGGVHGRYYEIRSMSGRYASYYNAFLFLFFYFLERPKNQNIINVDSHLKMNVFCSAVV